MTEFAFSGLGINPHYGTPLNAYDRHTGRIPAALCGLVGFKPTARRIPMAGAFPLSTSLDSIGPIASSVQCCATLDAIMAGGEPAILPSYPLDGLRLAIPQTLMLDEIDGEVGRTFERALTTLSKAGIRLTHLPLPELAELPQINAKGGFGAA